MDYIQEELLQQRKVLAALMAGPGRKNTKTDDPAEQEYEDGKRKNSMWQKNRKVTAAGKGVDDLTLVPTIAAGIAAGMERGGNMLMVRDTVISASARDAQELSRAIQRDARRYDGGFSLY